ncbi:MAG: PDZ domain-containing protein [Bdellovibrionota bacterium]
MQIIKTIYKFRNSKGLVITSVKAGSIAQLAGISKGQLIVNVNGDVIEDVKEFEKIVNKSLRNGIRLLIEESKFKIWSISYFYNLIKFSLFNSFKNNYRIIL